MKDEEALLGRSIYTDNYTIPNMLVCPVKVNLNFSI